VNGVNRPLRISFDLDDTLVVYGDDRPTDPCLIPFLLRYWYRDPLREGARSLLHELGERGAEIWVYTSSHRSESAIRRWWKLNRLPKLGGVINQWHHERAMRRLGMARPPTKLPVEWNIDIHIDDSDGVRLEQPAYSSVEIVVVDPSDRTWTKRIMEIVDQKLSERISGEQSAPR
jgi:hypothetical protein